MSIDSKNSITKININDSTAVKVCLDENIVSYILQQFQLTEDVTCGNYKLIFGYAAVLIAAVAQFYPIESIYINQVCIVLYGIAQIILQYITYIACEKNTILITNPNSTYSNKYIITSSMGKYSTRYTLFIGPVQSNIHDRQSIELHVTNYFDTNGILLKDKLFVDIEPFIKQSFEQFSDQINQIDMSSKKKK